MKKSFIIAVALILGMCVTTASAVEVTRFGPKQYICEKGKPQVFTDTFPADPGRGWLIVENGEQQHHQGRDKDSDHRDWDDGDHGVSSAEITLNGKRVFGPWTFDHHRHHQVPVHLRESNTLSVKVHGRPGSYLTIWVMQEVPIELTITSPENGATVSGPFLRVEGTVVHPLGHETGVIIYPHHKGEIPLLPPHGRTDEKKHHHPLHSKDSYLGIAAMVYGNQFVASHVPLQQGANTITAIATDTAGNSVSTSITVNVTIPANYIRITADTEMGISPLETTLHIEGSFSFAQAPVLTYTGPGEAQLIENPSPTEYRMRMTTAGIYTFMAEAKDSQGNTYTDTVTVTVLTKTELNALLQAKWDGMKSALSNQNVDGALKYFARETNELYRDIYTALGNNLPQIAQDMQNIQFIYAEGRMAKYRIRRNEEHGGQVYPITYYIYFVRDWDGLWKIYRY
jgi:hypothetical protein